MLNKNKKRQRAPTHLQHRMMSLLIKERTGPELMAEVESRSRYELNLASAYSALKRMEAAGWIRSAPDTQGNDSRVRRYWITGDGKAALLRNTAVLEELRTSFGVGDFR